MDRRNGSLALLAAWSWLSEPRGRRLSFEGDGVVVDCAWLQEFLLVGAV